MIKGLILHVVFALFWTATAYAVSTLELDWHDNSGNEDGFAIERAPSAAGPFITIATVDANVTTYRDANLPEATHFCYRVNAFNSGGPSPYSNVMCGVTKATLVLVTAGTGSGRVISQPAGIDCDASCVVEVGGQSTVTLMATAGSGSVFTGWAGACTGAGACAVTMVDSVSIIANFYSNPLAFAGASGSSGGVVVAGGVETGGSARGPAFQVVDSSGVVQATKFALNRDFSEISLILGNFDDDMAEEVLVGGREVSGWTRGPAYQVFDTDGTLRLARFVLNQDFVNVSFAPLNVGSGGVLVCGQEVGGPARGPAYQTFDSLGGLVHSQFVLDADFISDFGCLGANLDGSGEDEIIVGAREVTGLARGPAIQVFGLSGSLLVSQFVLNLDFTEMKMAVTDVGGPKNIVVYGRETSGALRGPAYQVFDSSGTFLGTRFVLNRDFTEIQVFGANTTPAASGEEIVVGGLETSGLARGPALQVWDNNGNLLLSQFVLNPDFTEVRFGKLDIDNDGVEEILVVGRETRGLRRGPAFQLFDGQGNLLVAQFVLSGDFSHVRGFAVDPNGDGYKEIGIGGIETSGFQRGPAYQIWEANGSLIRSQFVLNQNF